MIRTCALVIMVLFLVSLIGCSDKNRIGTSTKTEDLISIDLDKLEISAPIMYSELFDNIKFIELEIRFVLNIAKGDEPEQPYL